MKIFNIIYKTLILIFLSVISINFCIVSHYSIKSCRMDYSMVSDNDIHQDDDPDPAPDTEICFKEATLNYITSIFHILPDTKIYSNGKYIVVKSNKGFLSRTVNEMKMNIEKFYAYQEVCGTGLWQIRYQYICWINIQKKKSIESMEAAL